MHDIAMAKQNVMWICVCSLFLVNVVVSLPSMESANNFVIETEEQLNNFLDKQLRDFSLSLEKAALDIQEEHYRSYDTPNQRQRRDTHSESFPHTFTYDTGVGNREEVKLVAVTPFQSFNFESATDWEYFYQNGSHVLALASTTNGESALYVYSTSTNQFEFTTAFGGSAGVIDVESISIESRVSHVVEKLTYLVTVEADNPVKIYQVNSDMTLTEVQSIDDGVSEHVASFSMLSGSYLAIAVSQNEHGNKWYSSTVYKWHAKSQQFIHLQDIHTIGAKDVELFEINRHMYLAIANHVDNDNNGLLDSVIYKFDTNFGMFRTYQRIPTNGAIDWEYFNIGFEHYLIVANFNGTSVVYKWDGLNFVRFQEILAPLPACWHAIPVGTCRTEVLLVEGTHSTAVVDNIHMFTYKSAQHQFIKIGEINDSDGGHCGGLTSFRLDDGYVYLAKSNINGGNEIYIDRLDVILEIVDNPLGADYALLTEEITKLKENLTRHESALAAAQASLDDSVTLHGDQTIAGMKNFITNITISGTLFANTIEVEGDFNLDTGKKKKVPTATLR